MIDCLTNLIGIKEGCGLTTPASSFFINDLKGLTLKIAEAGVNEETRSGVDLIQERIAFAGEMMLQDIRTFLEPKMRKNSIIANDTVGKYKENLVAVASEAGKYKGIMVEIKNHNYLSFHLASVKLKLDVAVATNILVIDLMTGITLDILPITTVADEHTEVIINKSYKVKQQRLQLLIAIDSSVGGTYETTLSTNCSTCDGGYRNNMAKFKAVEILQASQQINSNTTTIKNTNGISINYSVKCDLEPFVCNMTDALAAPLLHKAGAEIMGELINSDRLNSTVLIYSSQKQELEEEFANKYSEMMNQLLDRMVLPNDICFECRKQVRHAVKLP